MADPANVRRRSRLRAVALAHHLLERHPGVAQRGGALEVLVRGGLLHLGFEFLQDERALSAQERAALLELRPVVLGRDAAARHVDEEDLHLFRRRAAPEHVARVQRLVEEKTAAASQKAEYERTEENIIHNWLMLGAFIFGFALLSILALELIDKDKR